MKAYRALSRIEHGVADDQGNQVDEKVFPYGSIVSGLSKETMKSLWDAGVLEQVDVPDTQDNTSTPAAGSDTPTEGGAAAAGAGS
jgi:hypothetical protein